MNISPPIFILADAHLRGLDDPKQHAFIRFLDNLPASPGGLIILGDLFEFMAGTNQTAIATYLPVLQRLKRFSPFHYLEGNHDFDLSSEIPGLEQTLLHPGPCRLEIAGWRFQLLHGDRADPRDLGTRLLRRTLQSGAVRLLRDYLLPDDWIFHFALNFASVSRRKVWPGRAGEAQVLLQRARNSIARGEADLVLYAHTHQGFLEQVAAGLVANPGQAVPGGSYLELKGPSLTLRRFPDGAILAPGPTSIMRLPHS